MKKKLWSNYREKFELDLQDWKVLEKSSEDALRKQLMDLEVTKKLRFMAKEKIVEHGGLTSEEEAEKQRAEVEAGDKLKSKMKASLA